MTTSSAPDSNGPPHIDGWTVRAASSDSAPWLTWISAAGLVTAVVLAAVGGLRFDIPMPTYRFGIVTPTCGLTRGSTALARADFGLAWSYNPASFLVVGAGVVGLARSAIGLTTNRWLMVSCPRPRPVWILVGIGIGIAALWLHQQSNADFIMTSRR